MSKKYNAIECYFAVQDGSDAVIPQSDDSLAYGGIPNCAIIVPIKFWEKNNCWDDSIGGHNVNNKDLINGGCCDVEMMEGIFECIDEDLSIEDFKQKMIDAGFTYNEDLIEE